jgi:hypothetical protein
MTRLYKRPYKKLYLIGSLRNPQLPIIGNRIRELGFDVFDDWFSGGEIADEAWQAHEELKGRSYVDALYDRYATHIWEFDKYHLDTSDLAVMVHPVGRSAHIELGYMAGLGKPTDVYFDQPVERWDVMLRFSSGVFFSQEDLLVALKEEVVS